MKHLLTAALIVTVFASGASSQTTNGFNLATGRYRTHPNALTDRGFNSAANIDLTQQVNNNVPGDIVGDCSGDQFIFYINIMGQGERMDIVNIGEPNSIIPVRYFVNGQRFDMPTAISPSGLSLNPNMSIFYDGLSSAGEAMYFGFEFQLSNNQIFAEAFEIPVDIQNDFIRAAQDCGLYNGS